MFCRKGRLISLSSITSSASRGCRGKEEGCVLQLLTAQVRKLRVSNFIVLGVGVEDEEGGLLLEHGECRMRGVGNFW